MNLEYGCHFIILFCRPTPDGTHAGFHFRHPPSIGWFYHIIARWSVLSLPRPGDWTGGVARGCRRVRRRGRARRLGGARGGQ